MLGPQPAAQGDGGARQRHAALERAVDQLFPGRGIEVQVHAVAARPARQVAVDLVRDERQEGCQDAAEGGEDRVQGAVRVELVGVAAVGAGRLPEAPPAAPDVPVRQLVDEAQEHRDDAEELVGRHPLLDLERDGLQPGEDPAVELGQLRIGIDPVRLPAVDRGVPGQERIGVPQRQEDRADLLLDAALGEPQVARVHDRRVDQVQAQRIGPVAVEDARRIGEVLLALRHLLAVLGEHDAVHDHVLERGPLEQGVRQHGERVEPARASGRGPRR